jgi:tetratricopeptide (TPR) repeat protein
MTWMTKDCTTAKLQVYGGERRMPSPIQLVFSACALVAIATAARAGDAPPDKVERARIALSDRKEENDAAALARETGLQYARELAAIRHLAGRKEGVPRLKALLEQYSRLADQLDTERRAGRRLASTPAAYRLLCTAHEELAELLPAGALSTSSLLRYAQGLERFDYALNALQRVKAYEAVLAAQPTSAEETAALRGKQSALLLADQASPGKFENEIVSLLDDIRTRHPKTSLLKESLLRTGDYLTARGERENAHRCYQECVERFGEGAVAARARLLQP